MARVMVVDDDAAMRHAIAKVLAEDGHEVVVEPTGQSALRHFAGNPVDLVISDVYMPDMDGLDFLKRLRETFPDAKVIMMSGGGSLPAESVLGASAALGANRVVQKPFTAPAMRAAIREVLGEDT